MKTHLIITLSILTLFFSCYTSEKKNLDIKTVSQIDSSKTTNQFEEILKTIPKNIQPIFGYRFIINGDFNGDGKKEKLIEHFISKVDNKETNKLYEGLTDFEQLVALTFKKETISFINSDNKQIDTLFISSNGEHLGLSYLKNEGDLNGDGTDEVSYVVDWADWSNINTWHLVTYKNNKWTEIYSFPIWDWQLPDLPETFKHYELFGLDNKIINPTYDSLNAQLEKELLEFKGLVKKIKTNTIQVIFSNDEADLDTMVVDLK
jgi:hypothetical protein